MYSVLIDHIPERINAPDVVIAPRGIVLHYIGNPGTSAAANANYFKNVDSQISVHYIVDDNDIIEIIPPEKKSYGTSSKTYNESFIQIEMCHPDKSGKISDETMNRVVWLCRQLVDKYGLKHVIRHYDVTGKRCPVYFVNNPGEWRELQNEILKEDEIVNFNEALKKLQEKGVISSPEYWEKVGDCVNYFKDLIINVANTL